MLLGIKSILIGLTQNGADSPRTALAYGLSLAQKAGAHVTVEAASLKLVLTHAFVSDIVAGLVAEENRRVRALAEAVAERARDEAAASAVNFAIEKPHLTYPDLIDAFVAQSRVHDIIILDQEKNSSDAGFSLMSPALFHSGRPVIVVPPGPDAFACDRVIIAWDGSAEAARAVNDALPFLRAADEAEIVSVQGEKDLSRTVPGAELAPHLARHGVNITVSDIVDEDGDVPRALRDEANRFKARLIVMGAFVHSRLREWILGGVTRSLLKSSPVPLLLAH